MLCIYKYVYTHVYVYLSRVGYPERERFPDLVEENDIDHWETFDKYLWGKFPKSCVSVFECICVCEIQCGRNYGCEYGCGREF